MADKTKFEYREWLLIKYARDWALLRGKPPKEEYVADYEKLYTKRERKYFLKLMRMMLFANYWMNTFSRKPLRPELEVCPIDSATIRTADEQKEETVVSVRRSDEGCSATKKLGFLRSHQN